MWILFAGALFAVSPDTFQPTFSMSFSESLFKDNHAAYVPPPPGSAWSLIVRVGGL